MAVEDYAKLKKVVQKNRADNVAAWKEIHKSIKETKKQLETVGTFISDSATTIQVNAKLMGTKIDDWVRVADQIIAKQTELKAAVKAKDKAKIKDLEKDIKDLHKLAEAHQQQASKTVEETNELKDQVIERHDEIMALSA